MGTIKRKLGTYNVSVIGRANTLSSAGAKEVEVLTTRSKERGSSHKLRDRNEERSKEDDEWRHFAVQNCEVLVCRSLM